MSDRLNKPNAYCRSLRIRTGSRDTQVNPLQGKNFSSSSSLEADGPHDVHARMNMLANAAFVSEALRRVTDVILPLNDSGTGSAIYCVHCITGVASSFRFMAQMLGPQQSFYGIQTPTKKRNAKFASSIEAISQYYVDSLIKFQPDGNFVLGGYSTGAIIALEMAQQLLARGREVSLLVILDGDLFNTGAEINYRNPYNWLKLILNLPRWMTGVMMEDYSFETLCRKAISKVIAVRKIVISKMRGESPPWHLTADNLVTINLDSCSAEHVEFMNRLFEIQFDYIPKTYLGRVIVYAAKAQWPTRLHQMKAAWRKVAPESEIVYVKGSHISFMRSPDGSAVAKHLAARVADL